MAYLLDVLLQEIISHIVESIRQPRFGHGVGPIEAIHAVSL